MPRLISLNSPWDLWIDDDRLLVAMAGSHQLWVMPLDESEIGPWAGNAREDIVDGPMLPDEPYGLGSSSFAQPSGLTADDRYLYVADSEGSSIRKIPLDGRGPVDTLVGTADLPNARLFTFGDVDGPAERVRLQHALGVAYHGGRLYVADTYNNKIKVVDTATGETSTLSGDGTPGASGAPARYDEPSGLVYVQGKLFVADTNNHLIRIVDVEDGSVRNLEIRGLEPPTAAEATTAETFPTAKQSTVETELKLAPGKFNIQLAPQLPEGWKLNADAPHRVVVETAQAEGGPQQLSAAVTYKDGQLQAELMLSAAAPQKIWVRCYFCQEGGEGLCRMAEFCFVLQAAQLESDGQNSLELELAIDPGF